MADLFCEMFADENRASRFIIPNEPSVTIRTHMKPRLARLLKAVAGIAGLVFLLAPVTGMGS
jgi:hypothetical protein